MKDARLRLALALGVSTLLHVWLMHTAQSMLSTPRVIGNGAVPLSAQLRVPQRDTLALEKDARDEPAEFAEAVPRRVRDNASAMSTVPSASTPADLPTAQSIARAEPNLAPLPQPSDPTYYGALSLDVYPKAITALELSALLAGTSAGQARATVLIDEAGSVNAVRAVQAASADVENAVRSLLLQTRFTPARKDGRVVKAQLEVSLDYTAR